jgi:predicted alpha/beta-fold hydrolase
MDSETGDGGGDTRRGLKRETNPAVAAELQFRPPRLLRNPHAQSILPSLPPRRWFTRARARTLRQAAAEWLLDCGELARLKALHTAAPDSSGRAAVLLHGWEGSAESPYVLSLGATLLSRGYDVVRLNLRDHGGTHHLNRELFHSCRLPEVVAAVTAIAARLAGRPLYLAGFSLGGNFLLRVAAEPSPPASIAGVVAISPVLDPSRTLDAMERGTLYHDYFVRRWTRSLRAKQAHWPGHYDFEPLLRSADLRRMTAELVSRHTDFEHCEAYLAGYAITGTRLATLRVPARILLADDDPIIPVADVAGLAVSPQLQTVRTRYGGHCGFMDSVRAPSFADRFVVEQFAGFAS